MEKSRASRRLRLNNLHAVDESSSEEIISTSPHSAGISRSTRATKRLLWPQPESSSSNRKRKRVLGTSGIDNVPRHGGKVPQAPRLHSSRRTADGTQGSTPAPLSTILETTVPGDVQSNEPSDREEDISVDLVALHAINGFMPAKQATTTLPRASRIEVVLRSSKTLDSKPKQSNRDLSRSVRERTATAKQDKAHRDHRQILPRSRLAISKSTPTELPHKRGTGSWDVYEVELSDESQNRAIAPKPRAVPSTARTGNSMRLSPNGKKLPEPIDAENEGPKRRTNMDLSNSNSFHATDSHPEPTPNHPTTSRRMELLASRRTLAQGHLAVEPSLAQTILVSSAPLIEMRLLLGLDEPGIQISRFLDCLSTGVQPKLLGTKLGGRFFRYLSILKSDSDRAPRPPNFVEQAKWLKARSFDHDQVFLDVERVINMTRDGQLRSSKEDDTSPNDIYEELAFCIFPATFITLTALFMLGNNSETADIYAWQMDVGNFHLLILRTLLVVTDWIQTLGPLLRIQLTASSLQSNASRYAVDDGLFQFWVGQSENAHKFSALLARFAVSLKLAADTLEQQLKDGTGNLALLKQDELRKAARRKADREADVEERRKYELMCLQTRELRERTRTREQEWFVSMGLTASDARSPLSAVPSVTTQKDRLGGHLETKSRNSAIAVLPPRAPPPQLAQEDTEWLMAQLAQLKGKPPASDRKDWGEILECDQEEIDKQIADLQRLERQAAKNESRPVQPWAL